MAKKRIEDCKTHDDFTSWANKHGGYVEHGGSHDKAYGPQGGGFASIPRHPGDLATGTRRNIVKTFIAIGLAVMILTVLAMLLLAA